jgi:hypothetical protein
MSMQPRRYTFVDPTLTHQVVFHSPHEKSGRIVVTCNCRDRRRLDPMGETTDLLTSRSLYNDPDMHAEPFKPEDRARW